KTTETPTKTTETPTKTTETPGKTITTETPGGFVEINKPRGGKAGPSSGPDDPLYHSKGTWGQSYDDQWGLKRIGFTPKEDTNSAWNLVGSANAPVIVAVIDTGIDAAHPELAGKLWMNHREIPGNGKDDDNNGYIDDVYGWNFIDNNNNLTDLNGHGTVNAGIIAAAANNGIGIAGINPNVRIMPLKALDFDINGGSIETARAILYAVDHGARVINVSIGGSQYSRFEEMAINYANEKGVVVVVAAGNEGAETEEAFPAGLKNVITVAATDSNNRRTNFSNWGKGISIAAPGVDILSLRARGTDILLISGPKDYKPGFAFVGNDNNYYRATGTSFSAPLVSGVASLLLSRNPKLTGEQVKRMILNSADDIEMPGWDQYTGYGLLNAGKALKADPDYYTDARISRIAPVRKNGKMVIGVYGTAESSDFEEAWVEAGFGEKPEEWEKAGETIEKEVKEGLIAEVTPGVFTKRGQWSLRLMVKTKSHGIKEAWGRIKIN
ncbi:MAG: S8 family serine peptidase, partial [Thermodesulfobacteriota bacterium]